MSFAVSFALALLSLGPQTTREAASASREPVQERAPAMSDVAQDRAAITSDVTQDRASMTAAVAQDRAPVTSKVAQDRAPVASEVAQDRAPAAQSVSNELTTLFARAKKDPAAIVPLLIAGSAQVQQLPTREALLLADTLEAFAHRAFFSPERIPGMEKLGLVIKRIEKGDVLDRIAARHRIGSGLIHRLNEELDESKLRIGQELKLLDLSQRDLEVVVERDAYRLLAWKRIDGGARVLVMCVPVGVGTKETPTPLGTTTIEKRVLKPQWTHPVTKKVYADGDPENVLGGYWIALAAGPLGREGIGLHGFTGDVAANWLEQRSSNGCVRMLQNDIDRFFHLAVDGTPVTIR